MPSSEKYEFENDRGETLAGRLELPDGPPAAVALFAHCFTCGKDIRAATRVSRTLASRGFAVLRFDFTGLGSSGGDFENTNFSSNVADLIAAAASLRSRLKAPAVLIGHSLGGAAVLAAAPKLPEVAAVATINSPYSPDHVQHLLSESTSEIEAKGQATVLLAGRQFTIQRHFLEDLKQVEPQVGELGRALLVFHAPTDELVGIDNARQIYAAAKHPKSFISLDDADHLLSRPQDADYVADVLAAWASRYIPAPDASASDSEQRTLEKDQVEVLSRSGHRFTQDIRVNQHQFIGDEPPSVGGADLGPSPYELLLAALGACTSMTLRMYADRKQLSLDSVRVLLKHSKIHASDCQECETKVGKLDLIEREIEIRGELTEEQRARLLEIADKCPVHRTLHSEVHVRTRTLP